jgi:heme/copper-type cytochrome/quinol oxidase subunit 2
MNPKINEILERMKKRPKDSPTGSSEYRTITGLSIDIAGLLVLLAEESEKNAKKIANLTNVLIGLTIVIALLTAVLVFFEFRTENKKIDQNNHFKTEQTQQNKQLNVTKK